MSLINGSLVVPVFSPSGEVLEMYGRKLLDNLRTGTQKHLYLPGPHAGLWNEGGLAGQQEVILTEALLDAMTFWCAGYRNVTASYGTQGFTDAHLTAFKAYGIEGCCWRMTGTAPGSVPSPNWYHGYRPKASAFIKFASRKAWMPTTTP